MCLAPYIHVVLSGITRFCHSCIYRKVVNLPGLVPAHEALYGVIDLLGNAKGVTLVDVSLLGLIGEEIP